MKKRVLAAMMACAMAAGMLSGCSSEPKNPGDSNEPVTTAAAGTSGESQAGETASAEESGPKIFHDYMTTDVDTINPHTWTMSVSEDIMRKTGLQLYRSYPNAEGTAVEYMSELAAEEPVQTDEEGKVWQIKIRDDAKWENGDAIEVGFNVFCRNSTIQLQLHRIIINLFNSHVIPGYRSGVSLKRILGGFCNCDIIAGQLRSTIIHKKRIQTHLKGIDHIIHINSRYVSELRSIYYD